MVYVDEDRCTGCGLCEDHCPTGAIRLVDGVATVDAAKCTECEACLKACPHGVIVMVMDSIPEGTSPPSMRPAPEMDRVDPRSLSVAPRSKGAPTVGSALAFLGREVIPRLMDCVAGALDRRSSQRKADAAMGGFRSAGSASERGGMGRRRHRRGRGWG